MFGPSFPVVTQGRKDYLMRRTALLVACLATFCAPALAQSVNRPTDEQPVRGNTQPVERDGSGERDPAPRVVVVSESVAAPQKTRSLVSRSANKGRIEFNIPWQTGIYQ